jgi:hypothetical protein
MISLCDIDKPRYDAKNITEYYSEHWLAPVTMIVFPAKEVVGSLGGFHAWYKNYMRRDIVAYRLR